MKIKKQLIEDLASLEHDQWMSWAENLMQTENLSIRRYNRYKELMVPYDNLPEEMKELDREWAIKVIKILKRHNYLEDD